MAPSSTAAGMTSRATLALALLVAGPLRCGGAFTRRSRSSALFSGKATAMVAAGQALDARDFGAKGDGVHDDAPALQKAIDAAQLSRRKLALPAGIYLVRPPLRPPSASPTPAHHDSPNGRAAPQVNSTLRVHYNGGPQAVQWNNCTFAFDDNLVRPRPPARLAAPLPHPPPRPPAQLPSRPTARMRMRRPARPSAPPRCTSSATAAGAWRP